MDAGLGDTGELGKVVAGHGRPPDAAQHALVWDDTGELAGQQLEPTDRMRKRPRDAGRLREDARRTVEYLASRGRTPTESVHDIARMEPPDAIAWLTEIGGCTKWQALNFWRECAFALLPYTAARIDPIDPAALGMAAMGGGMAMAHFLAAQATSVGLAAAREAGPGPGQTGPALELEAAGGRIDQLPPKPPD